MYHTFFNLAEPAFSIAVNPRYLYMSQQHKEALAHLLYGVSGGGFVMLTGEVGTGKTTIIRCLLEQMPENTDIAIVMNPMSNVPELLTTICDELDAPYMKDDVTVKDLTDAIYYFLLKNHTKGRNTVLLIDEAQLLSAQALEQIRLLTNLETTTQKLLHIILVGQPELKELLAQPELRQLAQRITSRFHLTPLTLAETQAYITHRLKVAGLPDSSTPFPYPIVKRIHDFTGGIPRLVNVICERCLIGAYAKNKLQVDNVIFNTARKEVINGLAHKKQQYTGYWKIAAAVLFAGVIANFVFHRTTTAPSKPAVVSKATSSASSSAAAVAVAAAPSSPAATPASANSATAVAVRTPNTSAANPIIRNYKTAEDLFFGYVGFPLTADNRPCGKAVINNIQCEKINVHTWTDVAELNRPAILILSTPEKFSTYLILIGLNQEKALVLNEQQEKVSIPLAKIGREWTGDIVYLWKKPPGFTETIVPGDSSSTVEWVAQQFAKIDNQREPLTNDLFSLALQERIKLFQRSKGLSVDGYINEKTLLKLNESIGVDKTLLTDFKE